MLARRYSKRRLSCCVTWRERGGERERERERERRREKEREGEGEGEGKSLEIRGEALGGGGGRFGGGGDDACWRTGGFIDWL